MKRKQRGASHYAALGIVVMMGILVLVIVWTSFHFSQPLKGLTISLKDPTRKADLQPFVDLGARVAEAGSGGALEAQFLEDPPVVLLKDSHDEYIANWRLGLDPSSEEAKAQRSRQMEKLVQWYEHYKVSAP